MDKSFIEAVEEHIKGTAEGHYGGRVQVIDLIQGQGILEGFAVGSIVKYIMRYTRTRSKKDLLKATHYIKMLYEEGEKA